MFNVKMKKNLSWPQFCEIAMGKEERPKVLSIDDKNNTQNENSEPIDEYQKIQEKPDTAGTKIISKKFFG